MSEHIEVFEAYAQAWESTVDAEGRTELLQQAWGDEGVLFDPETPEGVFGREALAAYIEGQHKASPSMVVTTTSPPEVVGDRLRAKWEQQEEGETTYRGEDFIEFASDGRIARLTMFFDPT